ncbi:hypothetical protein CDV31_017111 [Fusarium ambrosium]|uniref:Uncharacterized protein n=1 Tax=Fusarium ambrosium TaxID=131363 RepID=A0A428RSX6_9HYPO|nr:hypothetical protein CDV31_017111 [Fusarium ambrosium]
MSLLRNPPCAIKSGPPDEATAAETRVDLPHAFLARLSDQVQHGLFKRRPELDERERRLNERERELHERERRLSERERELDEKERGLHERERKAFETELERNDRQRKHQAVCWPDLRHSLG